LKISRASRSARYFTSDNLFGTQTIHDIIDALSAQFDVIILDLPPLMGLADGRFLAALADAVVLAIRWNATPAPAVKSAVGWLRSDGANLVGAMYTMVDATRKAMARIITIPTNTRAITAIRDRKITTPGLVFWAHLMPK
jgi:Mrp family chromosome partitioning ATPase